MDKLKVDALGKAIFASLMENGLNEAEAVAGLALGAVMRLAYDSQSFPQLLTKIEKLTPIFTAYAKANITQFEAAMQTKENFNVKN